MNELVESAGLDAPASNQRKYLITPANARELQQKATQARLHNQLAKKIAEDSKARAFKDEPRIALVERELARAAKMMSETEDVDSYQKLSAARARLFSEWQVLSGTPNPGARKSSGKRQSHQMAEPLPIEPAQAVNQGRDLNAESV